MFPYIFGPIIALRNAYSRSKRGYLAAKYAHSEGYTDYLWTMFPAGATQFVITAVYIVSLGKYDLTDFFERWEYFLRRLNFICKKFYCFFYNFGLKSFIFWKKISISFKFIF